MSEAIIVDLSGIATLVTLIGAIAIGFRIYPFTERQLALLIFLVSSGCLIGSLIMSEYLKLVPCDLCWWQRIFTYPLVILSGIALYRKNTENLFINTTVMSTVGLLFALFNIYVQFGPKDASLLFCDPNNPCSEIDVIALGFITLPMMAAVAFLFFIACSWAARVQDDRMEKTQ